MDNPYLRILSKMTCGTTLLLIFIGGMVTSTGSGLSVPDWPLSYGTWFPPMVGGVFYEHGHRMAATIVGFLMLCLAIWLGFSEKRRWVRYLGYWALAAVVAQGILGGMTVLFYLPTPVSVSHGVLAQTFFILTIILAYSQSKERAATQSDDRPGHKPFLMFLISFTVLIYIQLVLGAVMRHSGAGLAIPDFPKMGGDWIPIFNSDMLGWINYWRFDYNLDPVNMTQVIIHFSHRAWALLITIAVLMLNYFGFKYYKKTPKVFKTLLILDLLITVQITLGIYTVLTQKAPTITSLHVVTGAATLGICILLILRTCPLSMNRFKETLGS